MSNYQEMTDAELDKRSGYIVRNFVVETISGIVLYNKDSEDILSDHLTNWNPTHPDSNQAERYLFPKIIEIIHGFDIEHAIPEDSACFTLVISKNDYAQVHDCEDPDKINRTKVIACLEASEKLNG